MIKINGQTLFERVLHVFEAVFPEIVIVVGEISSVVENVKHRIVTDIVPECGSAGGLFTGLSHATHPYVFAAACDMPFLNPLLIRNLCEKSSSMDVLMVRLTSGLQPMHGIYSKRCLPLLEEMVRSGSLRLQEMINRKDLSVRIIEEEEIRYFDPYFRSFLNVNTPSDFEFAKKLAYSLTSMPDQDDIR